MKEFGFENQHNSDYPHHSDGTPWLMKLKDEQPEWLRLLLSQRSREGQYKRRLRRLAQRQKRA